MKVCTYSTLHEVIELCLHPCDAPDEYNYLFHKIPVIFPQLLFNETILLTPLT